MLREIKTMQQSSHRNLIQFIEHLEDNENVYIVMELAEGGTL
jgi:serine/threonine protein kinase